MLVFLIYNDRGSLPQSNELVEMVIYRIGIQLFIAPVFNKPPLWDATSRLFIPIYSAQKYFKTVIFQSKKAKKHCLATIIIEI